MLLLFYFRPPVHEICTNDEVVVFQPWTLNPPHLGSSRLTLYFNLALPPHLFLLSFLNHSFLPLSYRLPIRSRSSSKPYCFNGSPPPLLMRNASHLGVTLTRHPPASAAHPCAPRRMPASSAISCDDALPPFLPSDCIQVPVSLWGVCLSQYPVSH